MIHGRWVGGAAGGEDWDDRGMAHFSRLHKIVVDAPPEAHDQVVAFWRDALATPLVQYTRFPEYHGADLPHGDLGLLTQRLGAGPARVHLDIHTSDRAAEVARLTALGATIVDEAGPWSVLRDPAGLVFCVVPDPDLNATNATQWP